MTTKSITILILVSRESFTETLLSIQKQNIKLKYNIILCFNNSKLYFKYIKYLKQEHNITYFLNNKEWYKSYYLLYKKSLKYNSEYIYYLEDDDILITDFSFLEKENKPDYYFGMYNINESREEISQKEFVLWFMKIPENYSKIFKQFDTPEKFDHFQLSQLIIKKDVINKKHFPITNDKYNDYYLFKNNPGKIKKIYKSFFKQGISKNNVS